MRLKEKIKSEILERLEELEGVHTYDAIDELYNQDYYIIGIYKAREFCKENFDEMLKALEEYQENIGEQYPYITDIEKLATLTVLYTAEEIWSKLETVQEIWDNKLTKEDLEKIKKELELKEV